MAEAVELHIPRFHPARLNQLMGKHWGPGHKLKKRDRQMIWAHALEQKIPQATGKRRVTLTIILKPYARAADVDSHWKSTLDGLKHAKLLVDDSPKWVELAPVRYVRGTHLAWGSIISLEDL